MDDIVNRLRFQHVMVGAAMGNWLNADTALPLAKEAAYEIERLRAELADYRAKCSTTAAPQIAAAKR